VITGDPPQMERYQAKGRGYLQKPIRAAELAQRVQHALSLTKEGRA
jgi:CheY-like chemotaxis protein